LVFCNNKGPTNLAKSSINNKFRNLHTPSTLSIFLIILPNFSRMTFPRNSLAKQQQKHKNQADRGHIPFGPFVRVVSTFCCFMAALLCSRGSRETPVSSWPFPAFPVCVCRRVCYSILWRLYKDKCIRDYIFSIALRA